MVDEVNALIDAPLEIHLISVLWLLKVGVKYNAYINKASYAYTLELDNASHKTTTSKYKNVKQGYQLFQPYFIGYQKWRNGAVKEAERLLDANHNATIVSLDIKRFSIQLG